MSLMYFSFDDFIAGWFGGMCGLAVGHPFDTIKVRQQTYGSNFWETVSRTQKYEGPRGFYKGLSFPMLTIGPSNAIFFGIYGNLMRLFQHDTHHTHRIHDPTGRHRVFWAGCIAGFFQVVFFCPVELSKTVLQAKTGGRGSWRKHFEVDYTGTFDAFRKIYLARGIRGLYRGGVPMMLRDVPTSGIYTLVYEMLLYDTFTSWNLPQVVKQMLAGGVAGVLSATTVLPIDVVKSTMQADNPEHPLSKGTWQYFKTLHKEKGPKVFMRGAVSVTCSSFLRNGAIFVGYEFCRTVFVFFDLFRFLAWVVVIPVDNVKSRIEADNPDNRAYRGTIDCFIKTYKMGGCRIFFKGITAISIRAFPVNAVINVGYETMLLLLKFQL